METLSSMLLAMWLAALALGGDGELPLAAPGGDGELPCGLWLESTPMNGVMLAYECRAGSVSEDAPLRERRHFTREQCGAWCEANHPDPNGGDWCCEYLVRIQRNGVVGPRTCSWSDGKPYLRRFSTLQINSSAYTLCPPERKPGAASSRGRRARRQS